MGWVSGFSLMNEVIEAMADGTTTRKERISFYVKLIKAFKDHDCDTLKECLEQDDCFDEAYNKLHPEYRNY